MSSESDQSTSSNSRTPKRADLPPAAADWLANELSAWVDDGLIEPAQAEAIRRRHGLDDHPESTGRSRLVAAVGAVGAALVGAGIVVFLGTNWAVIPRLVRTLLLLVAPPAAFGAGWRFLSHNSRIGHSLWVLGALLAGPSLVLLDDLYGLADGVWLAAGWFAVALVAAEAVDSRPTLGIAIVLSAVTTGLAIEPTNPTVPFAGLGLLLVARSALPAARDRSHDPLAESYRIGGLAVYLFGILWLATESLRYYQLDIAPTGWLLAVGAAVAVGVLAVQSRQRAVLRPVVSWLAVAALAVALSTTVAVAVPSVAEFGALLAIHALLLAVLLAAVGLGYRTESRRLITAAVFGVFVQLTVFLTTTVADALSSSLALIVTGVLLLVLAVGLERGRRSVVARL